MHSYVLHKLYFWLTTNDMLKNFEAEPLLELAKLLLFSSNNQQENEKLSMS